MIDERLAELEEAILVAYYMAREGDAEPIRNLVRSLLQEIQTLLPH